MKVNDQINSEWDNENCFAQIQTKMVSEQRQDPLLKDTIEFMETGTLPDDGARSKRQVLERLRFGLLDGVLYYCETKPPHWMRIVVPAQLQNVLLSKAHSGRFSGHFAERALFKVLEKRFWWNDMRTDAHTTRRSCLLCATREGLGKKHKPPLCPIPVGGPFQRVAVNVLQLPLTQSGNKYAVVFINYLTKWPKVFAASDQTAETIAKLLVEHIICQHGIPEVVI